MRSPAFQDLGRRQFMCWFARSLLGVHVLGQGLGSRLRAAELKPGGRAKNVIYLYLRGGLSHVDSFDPKPGRPEMGGVGAIASSADGIQVSEWFPRLARQMHHISLVRSMSSTQGVHERGNYLAHTSHLQLASIAHPSLGSWVVDGLGTANPRLPGSVLVGGSSQHPGAGFMDANLAPLPIGDPSLGLADSARRAGLSEADFERRTRLAAAQAAEYAARTPRSDVVAYQKVRERAVELMKSKDLQAFDVSRENERTRRAYGLDKFGQGCLLARRLVESGVRFVEVEDPQNWDTHFDHQVQMRRMTPSVDQAMAALLDDLQQRGLLATTLVVMATEFGRSPRINAVGGRDHHPEAFTWWLAGAGVKGGYVHGKTDAAGERVAEDAVTMPDFNATVAHAVGLTLGTVRRSPSGRPFTVADQGRPVADVFG